MKQLHSLTKQERSLLAAWYASQGAILQAGTLDDLPDAVLEELSNDTQGALARAWNWLFQKSAE